MSRSTESEHLAVEVPLYKEHISSEQQHVKKGPHSDFSARCFLVVLQDCAAPSLPPPEPTCCGMAYAGGKFGQLL